MSTTRFRGGSMGVAGVALAATLLALPAIAAGGTPAGGSDVAADIAVKAAFLYNFAKFTEWPALAPAANITLCVVGSDAIAAALVETVKGQNISGHVLEVWRAQESSSWRSCHLLFVAEGDAKRSVVGLGGLKTLPVLTVSDSKGFSQADGIIELFLEGGRMRFAVNVDAVDASGLHLSSRLLGLAKVTRNAHAP